MTNIQSIAFRKFWIALCFTSGSFAQTVTTIAGTGAIGFSGDGGPGIQAQLNTPWAVRADSMGNVYFIDHGNFRVRKIDASGNISTVVGNGKVGLSMSGGPATQVPLANPGDLAVAKDGAWYLADGVLQIVTSGNLTSILTTAGLAVVVDGNGVLYYAQSGTVYRYNPGGLDTLVAGTLGQIGDDGDGGPALQAHFTIGPGGLAADSSGSLYITDSVAGRIRKFFLGGAIQTVAGTGVVGYSGDGGQATNAQIAPLSMAVDAAGMLYLAEGLNHRIRRVDTSGIITTVYHDSTPGSNFGPDSIAIDGSTNLYVGDSGANLIRKIAAAGASFVCTNTTSPVIASIDSASGYGGYPYFASGSWLEIKGSNLADPADPRLTAAANPGQWTAKDFNGVNAPTVLDGISVSINGKPAYVWYLSPTQLNVQAPEDSATGNVAITVTNCKATSATFAFARQALAPGLLAPSNYSAGGTQYMVATFASDGAYVLNTNTGAAFGLNSRPAKPGEVIITYGIGFGDVTPAILPGVVVAQSNSMTNPVTFSFGSTKATLSYSGLAGGFVGLYEFYITVPPGLANGDYQINVTQNGHPLPQTLYLTVHN